MGPSTYPAAAAAASAAAAKLGSAGMDAVDQKWGQRTEGDGRATGCFWPVDRVTGTGAGASAIPDPT